jgi:transposase
MTAEQQALLTAHRVRRGFVEERTATINRLCGLLSEFGIEHQTKGRTPSIVEFGGSPCRGLGSNAKR